VVNVILFCGMSDRRIMVLCVSCIMRGNRGVCFSFVEGQSLCKVIAHEGRFGINYMADYSESFK
jgi:hypothetical protein